MFVMKNNTQHDLRKKKSDKIKELIMKSQFPVEFFYLKRQLILTIPNFSVLDWHFTFLSVLHHHFVLHQPQTLSSDSSDRLNYTYLCHPSFPQIQLYHYSCFLYWSSLQSQTSTYGLLSLNPLPVHSLTQMFIVWLLYGAWTTGPWKAFPGGLIQYWAHLSAQLIFYDQ